MADISAGTPLRKTKIVATLGPSSWPIIDELIEAGVNVFRVNFSFGAHEEHEKVVHTIRQCAAARGVHIGILGDLCGPKIRVGELKDHAPITLKQGERVRLRASDEPGEPGIICTKIRAVVRGLALGQRVLLDDGTKRLVVTQRISEDELECEVTVGGLLKEKKGINVPDLELDVTALTDKDREDALFAVRHHFDYLGLSFAQRASDVIELRTLIRSQAPEDVLADEELLRQFGPRIIAKIEKPQALENIDGILDAADGIMVARGDLGVECELEVVPVAQKSLIEKARRKCKPVITATQMLETMIENPMPTRAEVSDVANAVLDGTDAVMLSGECATGKHPVIAVKTMAKICLTTEKGRAFTNFVAEDSRDFAFSTTAIADAAVAAARAASSPIIVVSITGSMALRISQRRPPHRIIAVTHDARVAQQNALIWGVYTVVITPSSTTDEVLVKAEEIIIGRGWVNEDESIILASGNHATLPGLHCSMRILQCGHTRRREIARENWTRLAKHASKHRVEGGGGGSGGGLTLVVSGEKKEE